MELRFWCGFLVLSLCARRVLALNQTGLRELAVITSSDDDEFKTVTTEITAVATTEQPLRCSRMHRHEREGYVAAEPRGSHDHEYQEEEAVVNHHDDAGDTKAMSQPKADYWGGYYDFLINEGSYKFWAVFQLATAALLIYSGFAALYYAKVNPQITDDYEDDFLLRRRRRSIDRYKPPRDRPFFGLEPQNFQRILDAIAREMY